MSIGSNIKQLRTMNNIKQKEMADALGFSCQNISKWENDISLPDAETILSVARFFNVSTDLILGNVPETVSKVISVNVNKKGMASVWTDFEYNGTIAPPALHNEGRHRADEIRPTRAASIGDCIMIGVNSNNKICFMKEIIGNRWHRNSVKWVYKRPTGCLCIVRDEGTDDKWYAQGKFELVLPPDGFLFVADLHDYKIKQLLKFIIPENYHSYLENTRVLPMYGMVNQFYGMMGEYLFSDVLGYGELDDIDVKLDGNNVMFSKPNDFVDPLVENIDHLTNLVKQRVESSLSEIKEMILVLQNEVEEARSMAEEAVCEADSCSIEELDERIRQIESKIR